MDSSEHGNQIRSMEKDKGSRIILLFLGVLLTGVFLAVVTIGFLGSRKNVPLAFSGDVWTVSDGWTDQSGNEVTLPAKLKVPPDGIYVLDTVLESNRRANGFVSLLLPVKYLDVSLYLNGETLVSYVYEPEGKQKTEGKVFITVLLPEYSAGDKLRIEARPQLGKSMEYEINAPKIGTEGNLLYSLIRGDLLMLVISHTIFCFGVILLMFGYQSRKGHSGTFFRIGLFAILYALYSLVITDTTHIFISNSHFIYVSEFLLLTVFPIPLVALVFQVSADRYKKSLLADVLILSLNFLMQTGLYYAVGLELRDTVFITHVFLALSVFLLFLSLAGSGFKDQKGSRVSVSFAPILMGSAWDLARFYLPGTYQKAVGLQIGVLLFIFLQTTYLISSYFAYYKKNLKSDLYRHMAYTDGLTGLNNRAAFERKILDLGANLEQYTSIWCVCADINDLKQVNDTLGHAAGDELIQGAAQVLRKTMYEGCDLFRTGGDEFVMFVVNRGEQEIENGRKRMDEALRRHNQANPIFLSIALGYDQFKFKSEDTITALISRADSMMYDDKKSQKEEKCERYETKLDG